MSRGPGRIQRALSRAFEMSPSAAFSAKEIIEIAFPEVQHQAKHRVAALRAARAIAEGSPKFETYIGAPRAGGLLLVNATDRRSLGIGKVFERYAGTKSVAECTAILDDPASEAYPEGRVDGFFDLLARRNAAWAEWQDDNAEILSTRIRERVAQAQRRQAAPAARQEQGITA